jgi:hypothetical protein
VAERERKSEREKERKTERQKDRKRKKEERIGVSVRDRLGLCFGIDAAFALGSNRPPTLWEKSYVNLPCREKRFSMFDFPKNIIPFPAISENPRCIYFSVQTYAPVWNLIRSIMFFILSLSQFVMMRCYTTLDINWEYEERRQWWPMDVDTTSRLEKAYQRSLREITITFSEDITYDYDFEEMKQTRWEGNYSSRKRNIRRIELKRTVIEGH